MASDDVVFVKYVPPPCDVEVIITRYIPLDYFDSGYPCLNTCCAPPRPSTPPLVLPSTPVWTDMWEDLDTDPSPNYNPNDDQ